MNNLKVSVEVLCEHPNNANTYIVKNNENLIIIDPANDFRSINTLIKNRNVDAVLLTHGHYDHFKTLAKILVVYDIKCYMHKLAYLKLGDVDISCARMFGINEPTKIDENKIKYINDGEIIKIGSLTIKCIFKPGHTDCSVIYIIDQNIFSGDFVFKNGIGRYDLPTGNYLSMKKSLNSLNQMGKNKDYIIYPGHGDKTSLYNELKNNPYF